MKKYDFIVSLGAACNCTQVLRMCQLQDRSYPFDWLWGGDFEKRCKTLIEDFRYFLNKEDLKFAHSKHECDAYYNSKNDITFLHDFEKGAPFQKSYPVVREKFDRRIKRFFNKINNSKKILFVYIENPNFSRCIKDNSTLFEYQKKFSEKFPHKKIDILYIAYDENIDYKNKQKEKLSSHIEKITYNYKSKNIDAEASDAELDWLCEDFKKYKINKKPLISREILLKIRRTLNILKFRP